MSHVDEGRLHAFLDGALSAADPADAERVELHLAACADCRALLDEATRLRDEAHALLGGAEPRAFVMPSFDAIRARSATVAPAQRMKPSVFRSPFNDFAWAAMVMLAIGLGWMLNDTMEGGDRRMPVPGAALRDRSASGSERATTLEIPISPVAPETEESGMAALDATQEVGAETGAPTPAPAAGAGAGERAAEYDVVADEASAPAVTRSDERRAAESFEELRVESQAARRQAPASSPPPPPPALAQAAPAPAAGAAAAAEGADVSAARAPTEADADAGWRRVTVAEAERLTDGGVVRLAGARITSSAARGSGTELEVLTVQLTDRGESIRVVQRRTPPLDARRREALESAAEQPAEATVTAGLTVRVEEWTVTISGAVAPGRLRELAAGLG